MFLHAIKATFFQIKNGISNEQSTSAKLVAIATSGEAGKVAVPNPGSKAMDRSSEYLLLYLDCVLKGTLLYVTNFRKLRKLL